MLTPHSEHTTDVVVVRHGETDWNTQGRIQGWKPIPLNDDGLRQVRLSAQALSGFGASRVYASPVLRVMQTAEILCEVLALDPSSIVQHDGLGEFRMGDYEGMAWDELIQLDSWRAYLDRPHETAFPGGGESLVGIRDRAIDAINQIVAKHGGGRLVVATHGGIARLLVLAALDAPLSAYHRLSVPNAGLSRFRLVPGRAPKVLAVSWSPTFAGSSLPW